MSKRYKVAQGDCISSIAKQYGFLSDEIWNDPGNTELKGKRENKNILLVGDLIVIPEKKLGEAICAAGQHHRFQRKSVPEKFRVRLQYFDGKPRAQESYRLIIDGGAIQTGVTDTEGNIEIPIPPNAHKVELYFDSDPESDKYLFALGYIDPITEVSGIQSRLNNLGSECGSVDGNLGLKTENELVAFQAEHLLSITGQADNDTRERLKVEYGC